MSQFRFILTALLVLFVSTASLAQDGPAVYEMDALNAGLGEPPEWLDRSTPQGAMEGFLFSQEAGDWSSAAHLLDLSDLPEDRQAEMGPRLARELAQVLDRKIIVDWHNLPDIPDAVIEPTRENSSVALQPRRSIKLWTIDLDSRPIPIRINRVQPEGGEPVWVFSSQTVRNIPALHDAFKPSQLEESIPDALRRDAIWGLRLWELIALPMVFLFAGLAGFVAHALLGRGARALVGRGGSILASTRGPITLAVVTFTLSTLARSVLIFSGQIDAILTPLTVTGFVSAAFWLAFSLGDAILDRLISLDGGSHREIGEGQEDRRRLATRVVAIRRAVLVIITLVGIGVVLSEANLLRTLGLSILASAGALTILVGFAARNILANIMASLQIALNGSAKIGDKILYKDKICVVERINFTYVQLLVWTGERLVVPVVEFVDEPFENWTMTDPAVQRQILLKLAHDADIEGLRDLYSRIMQERPEDGMGPLEDGGVYVSGHDVFGQDVLFLVPCTDPNTAWTIECEVREHLLRAIAELEEQGAKYFPDAQPAEAAA